MKSLVYFILTLNVNSIVVLSQDKPRFSIGLGTLSPSYSQKLAGNGRLDVDQDKNGFSYSLNNAHVSHGGSGASSTSYQSQSNPQSHGSAPTYSSGSDYSSRPSPSQSPSPGGHFSIYQHRSLPKQSSPSYSSSSDDDYNPPERNTPSDNSGPRYQSNIGQYNPPAVSSGQGYNEGEDNGEYREDHSGDYNPNEDQQGGYEQPGLQVNEPNEQPAGQSGGSGGEPKFGTYDFAQQISHHIQDTQPFQNYEQSNPSEQPMGLKYDSEPSQTYQRQPSRSPLFQSQPSHQRVIRLQTQPIHQPIQSQQRFQYKPQSVYSLRV